MKNKKIIHEEQYEGDMYYILQEGRRKLVVCEDWLDDKKDPFSYWQCVTSGWKGCSPRMRRFSNMTGYGEYSQFGDTIQEALEILKGRQH